MNTNMNTNMNTHMNKPMNMNKPRNTNMNKPINTQKNTIAICVNYLFDKCKYNCKYKHVKKCILNLDTLTDLSVLEVCKYNLIGFCENINCKNIHCRHNFPSYCIRYTKYGECNIINCPRIHEKKIDRLCRFYSFDKCKQGINCGFIHNNIKSNILTKPFESNISTKPFESNISTKSIESNILTKPVSNISTKLVSNISTKPVFNHINYSKIIQKKLNILFKNYNYNKINNSDIIINIKYTFLHFENKNNNSRQRSLSVPSNFKY